MVLKNIITNIITIIIGKATITTPTLPVVCPLTAQHTDLSLPPIHLNHRVKNTVKGKLSRAIINNFSTQARPQRFLLTPNG